MHWTSSMRSSPPRYITPLFLVEARDGDLLLRDPLLELLRNEQALRQNAEVADKLYSYVDADYGASVTGVYTSRRRRR